MIVFNSLRDTKSAETIVDLGGESVDRFSPLHINDVVQNSYDAKRKCFIMFGLVAKNIYFGKNKR